MISMRKDIFEGSEFVIQLIAKGAFVDNGAGDGQSYLIEVYTIRLNHVVLNEWILSETMNSRDCYSTNEEWEAYKAECAKRRKVWEEKIINSLGINDGGSNSITQAQAEVFTVVHITQRL